MKVKMILPALTEATSPFFRPIKYSLFPPLGLATLAGYLDPDDEVELQDEHVETLAPRRRARPGRHPGLHHLGRTAPTRSPTTTGRAARYVALGGLHVTSLPDEAAPHADTIFLGPGRGHLAARSWRDFRARRAGSASTARRVRTLAGLPPVRRDLIKRHLYLVPNSIVVSRGCPHVCDFCYKEAFFEGGASFYTQTVDDALAEIERLPGRHLYFLDDHLFGDRRFAAALFDGMRGHGPPLAGGGHGERRCCGRTCSRRPSRAGCAACSSASRRSTPANLREQRKYQNLRPRLRRGDPPPARPRRDGQRQLRLRHGRRRRDGVRAHGRVGRSSRASRRRRSTS